MLDRFPLKSLQPIFSVTLEFTFKSASKISIDWTSALLNDIFPDIKSPFDTLEAESNLSTSKIGSFLSFKTCYK